MMAKYFFVIVVGLLIGSAHASCRVGAYYQQSGLDSAFEYQAMLPQSGPDGPLTTAPELMTFYLNQIVSTSGLPGVSMGTSGGTIDVGDITCPVSFWTFYAAIGQNGAPLQVARFAFPTQNIEDSNGGGSGGQFGRFYEPTGKTVSSVFSAFRSSVESGSFYSVLNNWFTINTIFGSCPQFSYRVSMLHNQTAVLDLAAVFCGDMANSIFLLIKTVMLVGVAAIGIRIAFL